MSRSVCLLDLTMISFLKKRDITRSSKGCSYSKRLCTVDLWLTGKSRDELSKG